MNNFKIQITTWYDVVTELSARRGDFALTGQDMRQYEFNSIKMAVKFLKNELQKYAYEGNLSDMDVLQNYEEGSNNEHYYNCIDVSIQGVNTRQNLKIRDILDRWTY